MATEIEKKYRLPDERRTEVAEELRDLGAVYVGRDFEENTIYSGDELLKTGGIIRIRRKGGRTILTYKRRVQNVFDVKEQIEHETEVADAEAIGQILSELGMTPALVYEKYRETWRLRSVELVIDELPFGLFIEIEGSVTGIKEAEILLGIDDLEPVHETYPMLTRKLGTEVNDVFESRFPKPGSSAENEI